MVEDLPGEIWKDIPRYTGRYQVSNMCRVKSISGKRNKRELLLKIKKCYYTDNIPYYIVRIENHTVNLARLVSFIFLKSLDKSLRYSFKKDIISLDSLEVLVHTRNSNGELKYYIGKTFTNYGRTFIIKGVHKIKGKNRKYTRYCIKCIKCGYEHVVAAAYLADETTWRLRCNCPKNSYEKRRKLTKFEERRQANIKIKFVEDLPGEIWQDVVGLEKIFKVSNKGRVKSCVYLGHPSEKLIKIRPVRLDKKYKDKLTQVKLVFNKKAKYFSLGYLMYSSFIDKNVSKKSKFSFKDNITDLEHLHRLDACELRISNTFRGMKNRCYNKNNGHYKFYGAKGIFVCKFWSDSFDNFKDWWYSIDLDDKNKFSIDRIDPRYEYAPYNCQLISNAENASKMNKDIKRTEEQLKEDEISFNKRKIAWIEEMKVKGYDEKDLI